MGKYRDSECTFTKHAEQRHTNRDESKDETSTHVAVHAGHHRKPGQYCGAPRNRPVLGMS